MPSRMRAARNRTASFKTEKKIPLKHVTTLDLFDAKIPYNRVWWWVVHGCRGHYLEYKREGNLYYTTREAVERFQEATQ